MFGAGEVEEGSGHRGEGDAVHRPEVMVGKEQALVHPGGRNRPRVMPRHGDEQRSVGEAREPIDRRSRAPACRGSEPCGEDGREQLLTPGHRRPDEAVDAVMDTDPTAGAHPMPHLAAGRADLRSVVIRDQSVLDGGDGAESCVDVGFHAVDRTNDL